MCRLVLMIPLRFGDILMISDGECNVPSMKSQSMKSMNTSCHGNTVVIDRWTVLVILCWNAAILESLQNR